MEPICPYCNRPAKLIDSAAIYRGRSYGMAWSCLPCGAYVGTHKAGTYRWENGVKIDSDGTEPLGTLADLATRKARSKSHTAFDALWERGHMNRKAAYAWMRVVMNLPQERAHIAHMDAKQCAELVSHCLAWVHGNHPAKTRQRLNAKSGSATKRPAPMQADRT